MRVSSGSAWPSKCAYNVTRLGLVDLSSLESYTRDVRWLATVTPVVLTTLGLATIVDGRLIGLGTVPARRNPLGYSSP